MTIHNYVRNVPSLDTKIFNREITQLSFYSSYYGLSIDNTTVTFKFTIGLSQAQEDELDALIVGHPSLKWQLTSHLEAYRWQRENGGIIFNGYGIDTTDRSKALINGAYNEAKTSLTPMAENMDWKTYQGWVVLTYQDIIDMALSVADHVKRCFEAEKEVTSQIWAGTLTTTEEVEAEFDVQY